VIEVLWKRFTELSGELWAFLASNFDPWRDTLDILVVGFVLYWLLMLIKGTRAVQVLIGLGALLGMRVLAEFLGLATLSWILANFLGSAVLIIIVLFQADIRRALARVGRGVFLGVARQESELLEEIVRAAQALAQRRVGALMVLERETQLEDLIQVGTPLDATVTKDLLVSIFLPYSPLHDGAVVIQNGRIAFAGCILPLTLRTDVPEGVGTRHRAALGITEETDAVVIAVSEETAAISLAMAGEMTRDLDGPRLRGALRDAFSRGSRRETAEADARDEQADPSEPASVTAAASAAPVATVEAHPRAGGA
jgi:diadenylate cyclase